MRRTQFIEWGIITIGLIFGFKFFEGFFTAIVQLIAYLNYPELSFSLITYAILPLIYFLAFWLILRNSKHIAERFSRQQEDELVGLKINKKTLLQVIMIGVGLVYLVSGVTHVLMHAISLFEEGVGSKGFRINDGPTALENYQFKSGIVRFVISLALIYFSKPISGWFIQRDEVEELTFDSKPDN